MASQLGWGGETQVKLNFKKGRDAAPQRNQELPLIKEPGFEQPRDRAATQAGTGTSFNSDLGARKPRGHNTTEGGKETTAGTTPRGL